MSQNNYWAKMAEKGKTIHFIAMMSFFAAFGAFFILMLYFFFGVTLPYSLPIFITELLVGYLVTNNNWLNNLIVKILSDPDCKVDKSKYKV